MTRIVHPTARRQRTARKHSQFEIIAVRNAIKRGWKLKASGVEIANQFDLWKFAPAEKVA